MTAVRVVTAITLLAVFLAIVGMVPAAAAMTDPATATGVAEAAQETNDNESSVWPMVTWSLVVIGAFCLLLGILYLFKRRIGGFPENPSWTAPITVMPASENPTEETFGLEPDDHH